MIIDGLSSRGLAAAIARQARTLIAQEEANYRPASLERKNRWDALERFALYCERVGDDDLGIVTLWRTQVAMGAGAGGYSPGAKQRAALETVGASADSSEQGMLPERVMARLVLGALDDLAGNVQRQIAVATSRAEDHQARYVAGLEAQVQSLTEAHREALKDLDRAHTATSSELSLLRSYYERYRSLIAGEEPDSDDDEQIRDGVALPGFERVQIRAGKDGRLSFQARWPDAARPGSSKKKSGFATPQEAQAYADSMVAGSDGAKAREDVERLRTERDLADRQVTETAIDRASHSVYMTPEEAIGLSMDVSVVGAPAAQRNAERLTEQRVEQLVAGGMDRADAVYNVTGQRPPTATELEEVRQRQKMRAA